MSHARCASGQDARGGTGGTFIGHYGPSVAIGALRPEALWSAAMAAVCRALFRWPGWTATAYVAAAELSHWLLDWLVHRPDLPLYDDRQ